MVTERPRRLRAAADVLAACLLLALPWLLYGRALDLWWTEDDFLQLRYTLDHTPAEYSLEPEVWQRLPNRVLSPLLFVSYDLDLALFGLDAEGFYGHQLLAVGLAAAALFLVLRLWLPAGWSLLGGLVFLLGPPIASFPPLLMVRHYPESMLLGLSSAGAFGLAVRRRGGAAAALTALSALLYLAASAAKEIAVPLPAALALLPVGTARRRLVLLAPHAAGLALYAGYRTWMLGTPLGGYGWAILPGDWPGLVLALSGKVARELAGPSAWGWAALASLVAVALLHTLRSRRSALLLGAGLLLALLPILPASVEMNPRKASASWLVLAVAFAPAARALAGRRRSGGGEASGEPGAGVATVSPGRRGAGIALVTVALVAAVAGNRGAWGAYLDRAERMSAENRGYLELGRGDLIRHPASPPASMAQLQEFAREVLDLPARGGWFYDDLYLCRRPPRYRPLPRIRALWAFDPEAGRLVDVTAELPALRRGYCSSIRRRAPLEASFHPREGGVLTWTLGPYREGSYAFVRDEGRLRYDVPREGGFRLGSLARLSLRVRYESPDGWVTYSPPLTVGITPAKPVEWHRKVTPERDGGTG